MNINPEWEEVLDQLNFLELGGDLGSVDQICIDTLHGSMFGLNYRYTTLEEVFKTHKQDLLKYSIQRIKELTKENNFQFKKRAISRCQVGFGTFGWKYDSKLIETAITCGVSLIDTAEGYGYGKVETILGGILSGQENPPSIYTKVRRDHMSPKALPEAVKRSVQKLHAIPFEQLHFPHDKFSDSAIKILSNLQCLGKIKGLGLGNCSIDMIEQSQRILTEYNGTPLTSIQISFSLLNQRATNTIIPYCQERGILILAYSPLGQDFKKLQTPFLKKIAKKYSATESQIALSWILSFHGVVPIPATNNIEHLKQNIKSNDLKLDADDVLKLSNYYKNLYI